MTGRERGSCVFFVELRVKHFLTFNALEPQVLTVQSLDENVSASMQFTQILFKLVHSRVTKHF